MCISSVGLMCVVHLCRSLLPGHEQSGGFSPTHRKKKMHYSSSFAGATLSSSFSHHGEPSSTADSTTVSLHGDLEEYVRRGICMPFLPQAYFSDASGGYLCHLPEGVTRVSTEGWGLLQVQAMTNVAVPLRERVMQHVVAADSWTPGSGGLEGPAAGSEIGAKDGSPAAAVNRRILKMMLTDGARFAVAMESKPCGQLAGCHYGGKIQLSGLIDVRMGVLMLRPDNVIVVGGMVKALAFQWQTYHEDTAKRLAGAPPKPPTSGSVLNAVAQPRTFQTPSPPPPPPVPAPPPAAAPVPTRVAALPHRPAEQEASSTGLPAPLVSTAVNELPYTHPTPSPVEREHHTTATNAQRPVLSHSMAAASKTLGTAVPNSDSSSNHTTTTLIVEAALAEVRSDLSVLPDSIGSFSLMTLLLVTKVLKGDHSLVGGGELEVDLGNPWLMELLGMHGEDFLELSSAAERGNDATAIAELDAVVQRVSSALEAYGEGRFLLERVHRPTGPVWVVAHQEQNPRR